MTTSSSDQLKYQWSIVNDEGEEIIEDGECFKNSDSNTLIIDCFESKYAGTYRCVISTSNQPVVSMSAEVELDLPGSQELKNIVILFSRTIITVWTFVQNFLKILALK
jgi:hypothetical protein